MAKDLDSYQWWIDDHVSVVRKDWTASQLVQYWYDQTDRKHDILLIDLDLLKALIGKWRNG